MNEVDFTFDEDQYKMTQPWVSESSTKMFEINLNETFSNAAGTPICLPPGLVYVGERQSLVIFERPPRYQEVTYNIYKRDKALTVEDQNRSVIIPLPWQIYVGEFGTNGMLNALHLHFASDEITGFTIDELRVGGNIRFSIKDDGRLYRAPLPNLYPNYLVCLDKETGYAENTNLASKVNLMYASVWDTVFNADILNAVEEQCSNISGLGLHLDSSLPTMQGWFEYWQQMSLPALMDNLQDPESLKIFPCPGGVHFNRIILSDHFTTPSDYKLINTLQQIV